MWFYSYSENRFGRTDFDATARFLMQMHKIPFSNWQITLKFVGAIELSEKLHIFSEIKIAIIMMQLYLFI